MEVTTFIWMFLVLKIPVLAAFGLIWWAIKEPEPAIDDDDGGGTHRPDPHRGPRPPRPPRRGPHTGVPQPTPRVRFRARGGLLRHR